MTRATYNRLRIGVAIEDTELMIWLGNMELETYPIPALPLEIVRELEKEED